MNRRLFLSAATASLAGCAHRGLHSAQPALPATTGARLVSPVPTLVPIRAQPDRIFRITVCSRPFRAAGPRLEIEKVGDKTVVHNYGHGGSGWSLSWGSSRIAADQALSTGEQQIGVIGCGALGLTSALLLQQSGAHVTIYAKERPPEVRSARATGSWTPDSRIALTTAVAPTFPALWEKMCRTSFHMYESYLGLAGNPVEWTDRYMLSDDDPTQPQPPDPNEKPGLPFARYMDRVRDITPRGEWLPAGSHPFPTPYVRRTTTLTFNVAAYARQLVHDFLTEGGRIEHREFHSPDELAELPEKAFINATGYGARALWKDESVVPVRGQIAWLIPQEGTQYGLLYNGVYMLARRDGVVIQEVGKGDMDGYNNPDESPDRAQAEAAVGVIGELYQRMAKMRRG